jgi:proline dehydrogenase
MIGRALILKTAAWKPMERLVRRSFLFRPLVKRFIAGDTLEQALPVCEDLVKRGFFTSLDLLGENTSSSDEAIRAKNEYIRMLEAIGASSASKPRREVPFPNGCGNVESCNISIKMTQCGLDQGDEVAYKNLTEVLENAKRLGLFVRVDMESSGYTERTMDLVSKAVEATGHTGFVLQSYLRRTDADLDKVVSLNARCRLVKGAYLEPSTVAYPDKKMVDEQYIKQAKRLLKEGFYPAIATHDEKIIGALNAFVEEENIDKATFEYQMLFGIRRDLQEKLLKEGFNVRVYVPFGDAWYPYFTRRLAERPANFFFILKSMVKG